MFRARLSLTVLLALAVGCTGSEDDDDGTAPPRDGGVEAPDRDAGFRDGGVVDAGFRDGGFRDGGARDAGPRDGGDPCAPIARGEVASALAGPLGRFVDRCVPELDALESTEVGGWVGGRIEDILRDGALVYDDVAAGLCLCDLETLACDTHDPFKVLSSCAAVVTGTIAEGDACTGYRCEAGLECWHQWEDAPVSCEGVCVRPRAASEDCQSPFGDPYPCVPGNYCRNDAGSYSCEPLLDIDDECTRARRCRGDRDAFLFPTTFCDFSTKLPTCQLRGRDQDDCTSAPCHALYECGPNDACVLKARAGEACALPVPDPESPGEFWTNAVSAYDACLINPTNARPGNYCVLTSTTTGAATCLPLPAATEACGVGTGLSAACAGRSICAGIDPSNLLPAMGTCADPLADGAECITAWGDEVFGLQCENGTCDFGDPSVCAPYNPNGICVND